jgi:hypothetical protein
VPVIEAAFETLGRSLEPVTVRRTLPNFAGEGQADSRGYDAATLQRLRALKRERDPHGVIRSNKPVLAD